MARTDPGIFRILGGHHASLNSEAVVDEGDFDAICIGEGERALTELAESLTNNGDNPRRDIMNLWFRDRETGEIYRNPQAEFNQDLDALPYLNRRIWDSWIEQPSEYPSLLLGRGCPFKCRYCSNHKMANLAEGNYVRFRSPENIVGELINLRKDYPEVERVYLEVETFGANRKASYAIFEALAEFNKSQEKPIKFGANMALTSYFMKDTKRLNELVTKAKAANLATINVGLESGSERMRKDVLRRPKYTNNELIQFCREAQSQGINIIFYVLLGLPGETVSDYMETVRVARAAQPFTCLVSIFYPYLGTELAEEAINMGLIEPESLSPKGERSNPQMDLPGFSRLRIRFEYIIFWWRVYRGHWNMDKVLANCAHAFLRAYPKFHSLYLFIRNNNRIVMRLANRYGMSERKVGMRLANRYGVDVSRDMGERKIGTLSKKVGTRVDVVDV